MSSTSVKIELPRLESGKLAAYAWPGGYPLVYVTQDGGTLCPDCARKAESEGLTGDPDDPQWYIIVGQVNWEDETLYCDGCNKHIEPAYGNDPCPYCGRTDCTDDNGCDGRMGLY